MGKKSDITHWNVPVDRPLNDALEEAIKLDWHRTKAEFIRAAVRRKLEDMGFSPPRPQPEAKRLKPTKFVVTKGADSMSEGSGGGR